MIGFTSIRFGPWEWLDYSLASYSQASAVLSFRKVVTTDNGGGAPRASSSSSSSTSWQSMLVVLTISAAVPTLILFQSLYLHHGRSTTTTSRTKKNSSIIHHKPVPYMDRTDQGASWPFLGQALTFWRHSPWDLITQWHRDYRSPIICFHLLGTLTFSVASPPLCRAILQSQIGSTKKDVENAMKPFLSILGTGIVTAEGPAWFQQRRAMSHPLRFDVLQYIPDQTLRALDRLCTILDEAASSSSSSSSKLVPMGALLRHLTLQVISGTFLSLSATESDEQFATLYLPIVEESNLRVWHPYRRFCFFLPSFWRYHYNVYRLNHYVSGLIRRRWRQGPPPAQSDTTTTSTTRQHDVLDTMLAAYRRREHPAVASTITTTSSSQLSSFSATTTTNIVDHVDDHNDTCLPPAAVRQLRDEIKTFMLAGHETSAAMMTWTLYELVHHPELMQQVVDEGRSVWNNDTYNKNDHDGENKSEHQHCHGRTMPPTPEELSTLDFAESCLKESLRKYSVVPVVARLLTKNLTISDGDDDNHNNNNVDENNNSHDVYYTLPKGSAVMIDIVGVHLDPALWPQPLRYDPHRFYRQSTPPAPYTFLPFIAGPRNCLGQNLALLESKMVISLLLHKYRFRRPSNHDPNSTVAVGTDDWSGDRNPRHRFMVPLIPKQEVMLYVEKRN